MVVLVWLLCGVVAAVIASQKNRNVAAWGLAGILGGFITLIIIALMPAVEPPVEATNVTTVRNQSTAPANSTPSGNTSSNSGGSNYCQSCGEENISDGNYCSGCGNPL